jgi:ferredoxin
LEPVWLKPTVYDTGSRVKVSVDRARCASIGICESLAPEYYEVGDDGTLSILQDGVSEADVELIRKTVSDCPTGALSFNEA